jgi:hypothetical protein
MRLTHLAVLALAACASAAPAQQTTPPAVFNATSLDKLASHKATEVTGVIGAPVSRDPATEGTVYTWYSVPTGSTWVPTPVMTARALRSVPPGADSDGGQDLDAESRCRVRITVDSDSDMRQIDFHGSRTACTLVKSQIADWLNKVD